MKTAEEIMEEVFIGKPVKGYKLDKEFICNCIELAQVEAYNKAIDDALEMIDNDRNMVLKAANSEYKLGYLKAVSNIKAILYEQQK